MSIFLIERCRQHRDYDNYPMFDHDIDEDFGYFTSEEDAGVRVDQLNAVRFAEYLTYLDGVEKKNQKKVSDHAKALDAYLRAAERWAILKNNGFHESEPKKPRGPGKPDTPLSWEDWLEHEEKPFYRAIKVEPGVVS